MQLEFCPFELYRTSVSPHQTQAAYDRLNLNFQSPRVTHLSTQPGVCFAIADELHLLRIPFELLAGTQCDDPDMAHCHRMVTNVHVANRLLAAAEAIFPVA